MGRQTEEQTDGQTEVDGGGDVEKEKRQTVKQERWGRGMREGERGGGGGDREREKEREAEREGEGGKTEEGEREGMSWPVCFKFQTASLGLAKEK